MIKKLQHNLPIIFILLIAAFCRLYRIRDYLTFLGDEGRDVLVVYNILHGHFTLLGPTSSVGGFFLGPIYYYFMAPFLWFSNYDPVGPAIMVALAGIVTVWLVYKIGSEFYNQTAGIIGAFFYAISPLVLTYSRSSWNPNLMPFFTLLTLYTVYKGIISYSSSEQSESRSMQSFSSRLRQIPFGTWLRSKNKYFLLFLLAGFLFGITMQLHYLAVFVGAIIAIYIFLANVHLSITARSSKLQACIQIIKQYALFLVGFLVGFSPFLAFEFRHGMQNIKNIILFVFHGQDTGAGNNFFSIVWDIFYRLFARLIADVPSPDLYHVYTSQMLFVWQLFALVIGFFASGFLVFLLLKHRFDKKKLLQYLLFFVWGFLGIVLFGLYKKNIYDYYFEFMFTLPFFLVGGFLSYLWSYKTFGKVVAAFVVVVLFGLNILYLPFRFEPNRQLNQAETIAKVVLEKTNGKPFNFALITGGNSDHAYRYWFTVWGHPPVTIQYPGIDPKRKSVTDQLLVVCESIPCQPEGNSLWEVAGFGRAKIVGEWDVIVVKVYKLVHYTVK